jgi:signal peptidase I
MKNKITIAILILFTLTHAFIGLWWMSALSLIAFGVYYLATSKNKYIVAFRRQTILIYTLSLTGIFLFAIILRVLIFGFFVVPTSSMERTILPGDVIWVNKTLIGPRLPSSPIEIPWLGVLYWMLKEDRNNLSEKWFDYHRLEGYSSISHQDILVFEHPYVDLILVKRCIGCPGDTLQIINSKVSINSQYAEEAATLQLSPDNRYDEGSGFNPEELFPHDTASTWTPDNFGPVILPYKGMAVSLNKENYLLYHEMIENLEKIEIVMTDAGNFTINGSESEEYTFQNNYYFMMGDNRHYSHDSRFFGPVPESLIIGKATTILFSTNKQAAWYQRILKKLK